MGVGSYRAYTVSAADALGRPVAAADVTVTATEKNADGTAVAAGSLNVTSTAPAEGAVFIGAGSPTDTASTSDGQATGTIAGQGTIYIASTVAGTVSLSVVSEAGVSTTGSLTVNPAGVNDIRTVTFKDATQKAFTGGKTVTQTITLANAQGDPVVGVTPVVSVISGPDVDQAVAVVATNGLGVTTATYETLPTSTPGTDTVQAFVNQTGGTKTAGLDAGEPVSTATVVVAAEATFGEGALTVTDSTVPADVATSALTFTLKDATEAPVVGYTVAFSVPVVTPVVTPAKYSLNQFSAVTNAQGQVTVTVSNAAPAAGNTVAVTAALVGDADVNAVGNVTWAARTVAPSGIVISPAADTEALRAATTHTVQVTDQFGTPVPDLTYNWVVTGRNNANVNAGATGTGASFTYTDSGNTNGGGADVITVTASKTVGTTTNVVGSASVNQYWVTGTAKAAQANIDLGTNPAGTYGTTAPYVPSLFTKTATAGVTTDPTSTTTASVTPVSVLLIDANGQPLYGKSVSFSSTGVGVFAIGTGTTQGQVIGNSTSALVDEATNYATVYVRSNAAGTQTITATVDGITDAATVTYTGQYVPVTPFRVVDTRNGQGGVGPVNPVNPGLLAPNTLSYFDPYQAGIPDAAAYVFNVTAINPSALGNLSVSSGDSGVPTTSLVNYQPGKDTANMIVVPNSQSINLYSDNASVAVAIDLVGYFPTSAGIATLDPSRVADTRKGGTPVAGGTSRSFQIAGNGGIPVGATSVALNVTAINPSGLGNLRVYPDGATVPTASNINYIPGVDKSAFVIVNLPANGKIDVYSDGGTAGVAIDAFAYFRTMDNVVTAAPVRILDTRTGTSLAANTPVSIPVAGKAGVPADAQAVLVSVTGIHNALSTGIGNLRVYPTGGALPVVSTLNYISKSTDVANFAIVKLGTNGAITLYSDGSPIDVAVDVVGFIPAGS